MVLGGTVALVPFAEFGSEDFSVYQRYLRICELGLQKFGYSDAVPRIGAIDGDGRGTLGSGDSLVGRRLFGCRNCAKEGVERWEAVQAPRGRQIGGGHPADSGHGSQPKPSAGQEGSFGGGRTWGRGVGVGAVARGAGVQRAAAGASMSDRDSVSPPSVKTLENRRKRQLAKERKARKKAEGAVAAEKTSLQSSLEAKWMAENALRKEKAERELAALRESKDNGWVEQRRIRNELAIEKARKDLAVQKARDVEAELKEKRERFDLWAQGRSIAIEGRLEELEGKRKSETVTGWAKTVVSGQTGSCAPSAKNSSSNGRLSSLPSLSVGSSISNRERFLERRAMKLEEDFRILEKENERLRIAGKKYKDIVDQDDRLHKLVAQTTY